MQNPTMLLWIIQAERRREMEELDRVRLAVAARGRRPAFGAARRLVGLALVRIGLRLLPRDGTSRLLALRLAATAGVALPAA